MLKKTLLALLIYFTTTFGIQAQAINDINVDLGIPDSLEHERELRIYKGRGIFNKSELFRIYQTDSQEWNVYLYEHWIGINEGDETEIKTTKLTPDINLDIFWLELIMTDVEFLPEMEKIRYKFKKDKTIVFRKGKYTIRSSPSLIFDGTSYLVETKNGNTRNKISYSNPERYLKGYPEIDEIASFNKLLDIIKNTLNIWSN